MVGSAVRSKFSRESEYQVRGFLELASENKSPMVQLWRTRSLDLLKKPAELNYSLWCGGGYARSP
jgi:hypothetical protein